MADQYQRLVRRVSYLQNVVAKMMTPGTVKEVKGDMMRCVWGKDKDGKEVLGPWINCVNTMRGGAKERRFFKEGQNVLLLSVGGDVRQSIVLPYSPNKKFGPPDHANKTGQDEETYQLDDLRVKKTKEGYDIWLQPPKKKQQQQQAQTQGQSGTGQSEDQDGFNSKQPDRESDADGQAVMKIRLNKDGGFTGRIGKNIRVAAHAKGAKVKADKNYAAATPDKVVAKAAKGDAYMTAAGNVYVNAGGIPLVNKPWQIGGKAAPEDPIPDDDK